MVGAPASPQARPERARRAGCGSGRRACHGSARRGWALLDVIIGGVILAVGLAAIISLAERSLAMQQRAEREAYAAQLLDSVLNQVLSVGPVDWQMTRQLDGRFDEPFNDWRWQVQIVKQALSEPYRVTATVLDEQQNEYVVDTLMAPRITETEEPARAPTTPIDRKKRYDEMEAK